MDNYGILKGVTRRPEGVSIVVRPVDGPGYGTERSYPCTELVASACGERLEADVYFATDDFDVVVTVGFE